MTFRPRGSPKSRTQIVIPQTLVNAVWAKYNTTSDRLEIMTTIHRFVVEQKRMGVSDAEILDYLQREEDDLNFHLRVTGNIKDKLEAGPGFAQAAPPDIKAIREEIDDLKKTKVERGNREIALEAIKLAISTATLFFFR